MSNFKRTVFITGYSDDGLGAVLVTAFHNADLKVYATARNSSKMSHLAFLDIEMFTLNVTSESDLCRRLHHHFFSVRL